MTLPISVTPAYWQQACTELAGKDAVMAALIARYPAASLVSRGDAFYTLARSIVGQQISMKAADSVWNKFLACVGVIDSARILATPIEQLRACGLSARKVEYLQALSLHQQSGRLDVVLWQDWGDEDIINELTAIRGIGRWSAEMFLMFYLLRPDVLPLADIGLVRGVALNYHAGERRSKTDLLALAANWQPWRSVATWYLWRSLDTVAADY